MTRVTKRQKLCMTFEGDAVTQRTAQKWYYEFRSGEEFLKVLQPSEAPRILNDDDLEINIQKASS